MKSMVTTTVPSPALAKPAIEPRLIACLVAVYLIWSSTYLAMRIVVHELPPLLTASLRFILAGIVMLVVARGRGHAIPPVREWLRVAPIGALLFLGGNGFVSIAEKSVSSGGAAVVCATMPLWVGVLGVVIGKDTRPSRREWLALVVGFVGVLVLMGGPTLEGKPEHIVLVICSPIAWAIGSILARRLPKQSDASGPLMLPAMQMLTGGAALLVVAVIRGERLEAGASIEAWLALGYLLVFGSLVAFTAYAWLLRNARPVVATSYAYVNPILAVLIAAIFYGEPLGWTTLVANVLIVGAVMLALYRPRVISRPEAASTLSTVPARPMIPKG